MKAAQTVLVLLLALQAPGISAYDRPRWYPADHLQRTADALLRAAPPPDRRCPGDYRRLTADGRLRIAVFFGFMNLTRSGIVLDPYNRYDLQHHLQRPCRPGYHACGFQPDPRDPDRLVKTLQGPDDSPVRAEIRLYHSALTDDYDTAVNRPPPGQRRHRRAIRQAFLDSLDGTDALFYVGHSRLGSGPGFYPMPWPSRGWLDAWLLDPLLPAFHNRLRDSAEPPALIGLFACTTEHYYLQRLAEVSPGTAWIGTLTDTYSDADNAALLASLEGLLGGWCKADVARALDSASGTRGQYTLEHWLDGSDGRPGFEPLPWILRE